MILKILAKLSSVPKRFLGMRILVLAGIVGMIGFSSVGEVRADFIVTAGTVTLSGTGTVLNSSGSIVIGGAGVIDGGDSRIQFRANWNNGGVFIANTSTVSIFDVMASSLTGNTTFNVLVCTEASKTIYFQDNGTQTIKTVLTLSGQAVGTRIVLRPSLANTTWYIQCLSSQTVSFVDVQYSSAMNKQIGTVSSLDSGANNALWVFPSLPVNPDVPTFLAQYLQGFGSFAFGNWTQSQQVVATFTLTDSNIADTMQFHIQFSSYSNFSFSFISSTRPAAATLAQGATNFTILLA